MICFPSRQNVGVGTSRSISNIYLESAHTLLFLMTQLTSTAKNYTSAGTVGVLLAGTCLSIPAGDSIDHIVEKLKKESPRSKSESVHQAVAQQQMAKSAGSHRPAIANAISR